jgi:alpha/beta superfamily hydrolase
MRLLMNQPEVSGFISVALPMNILTSAPRPCPISGLIVHGDRDGRVPDKYVTKLVQKLGNSVASRSSTES